MRDNYSSEEDKTQLLSRCRPAKNHLKGFFSFLEQHHSLSSSLSPPLKVSTISSLAFLCLHTRISLPHGTSCNVFISSDIFSCTGRRGSDLNLTLHSLVRCSSRPALPSRHFITIAWGGSVVTPRNSTAPACAFTCEEEQEVLFQLKLCRVPSRPVGSTMDEHMSPSSRSYFTSQLRKGTRQLSFVRLLCVCVCVLDYCTLFHIIPNGEVHNQEKHGTWKKNG